MTTAEIVGYFITALVVLFALIAIVEMRGAKKSQVETSQRQAAAESAADARFCKIYSEVEQIEPKIDQTASRNSLPYTGEIVKIASLRKNTKVSVLSDYVAIDVETTGLNPRTSEIIQVSAMRFINQTPDQEFTTYIRPRSDIPEEATEINGITDGDVADAPKFEWIAASLKEFIGNSTVVAHNIDFDMKFLLSQGLDLGNERRYFDTLELSRTYDDISSHKLADACAFHGIHLGSHAHDAGADALACGMLFAKYIEDVVGVMA